MCVCLGNDILDVFLNVFANCDGSESWVQYLSLGTIYKFAGFLS